SLGYLNQEGIIIESGLKRVTAGLTSNFRFLNNRKLGLDFNVITANNTEDIAPISTNAGFTGSLIGQALQWNPTHPLRKPNDSIWINNQIGATTINPLAMLAAHEDRASTTTVLASLSPSFRITNNLEYRLLYAINFEAGVRRNQVARWLNIENIENRGIASVFNNQQFNQTLTNTISYNHQITQALNLNAVVGHEYLQFDSRGTGTTARDFADLGLAYYNILGYSTQNDRDIFSFANPTTELQSFFGRVIANYRDKYLLTATMRADGSTRFGENNKYGYFPSVALAWNLNNEEFFKGNAIFSNLKLRLGWGKTGNQEFPSGASLNRFVIGRQAVSRAAFGNPDLVWETSTTTNAGVDFAILRDRLTGSVDYFYKKNEDVLYEQTVAAPGPAGTVWVNLPGYIKNSGVEVALNGGLIRSRDMNWNLGVNATWLENSVNGLAGFYETGELSGQGISGYRAQRIVNGQPLNVYYLPIFEGIDKSTGQAIYTGGDPSINRFYVGSPQPKWLLGITTDFNYKKFTATINMNGAFGHYLYNNTATTVLPIGNLGTRNIAKSLLGGDVQEAISNPIAGSTRFLEKGNYLKMANATLSYALGNIGTYFRNATISLTGQNLFVLTNFTGFDPEVNTDKSVGGIPSLGIEYTPYPTARTVLLGITFSL
ncbi:MAG: TonB-dependent receptor, partial [Bacteroidota bacterium]|nr:TonB-dependent receptor [Bacteroidota bacterium]